MIPNAVIHKKASGKKRVIIPPKHGDKDYFDSLVNAIVARFAGVDVSADMASSSIIVTTASEDEWKRILGFAEERGFFQIIYTFEGFVERQPLTRDLALALSTSRQRLDKFILKISGGKLDSIAILTLLLFWGAYIQLRKSKFLPAGLPLLSLGLGMLQNLQKEAKIAALPLNTND